MSIFKETFYDYVQKQIRLRQQLRRRVADHKGNEHILSWEHSKTAWIRFSSGVDIISETISREMGVPLGNAMAKTHVLQGGELYNKDDKYALRRGIGDNGGAYGDKTNRTRDEFGLRPMTGITSLQIASRGAYGSLRDATITFQCWTRGEIDRLSLLFARPGMTGLIEWGWTHFFDNSQLDSSYTALKQSKYFNILDKSLQKEQVFERLYNEKDGYVAQTSGNYDAFFGIVKSPSVKSLPGGGWECTVTLSSVGEVIESLKMNYVSELDANAILNPPKPPLFMKPKPDRIDPFTRLPANSPGNKYKDSFFESKLGFILESIISNAKQVYRGKDRMNMVNFFDAYNNSANDQALIFSRYAVYAGKLPVTDRTAGAKEDPFTAYIRIKDFFELLNFSVLLHDHNDKPFIQLTSTDHTGSEILCEAHYFQQSSDPTVCLIRPCADEKLLPPQLRTDFPNIFSLNQYFFRTDKRYNKGLISNIYLNCKYLLGLTQTLRNDQGYLDTGTFFDRLFTDLNRSLGHVNKFGLYTDPSSNQIFMVDFKYLEESSGKGKVENKFKLQVNTFDSMVREGFGMSWKIFPQQSAMIAIAGQAGIGSGTTGIENFTFDVFNGGIQDRHIIERYEPGTGQFRSKEGEEKRKKAEWNSIKSYLDTILAYNNLVEAGVYLPKRDMSETWHRLIMSEIKAQTIQNKSSAYIAKGILPLVLTIPMDGIAGIVVGQIFCINEDALPYGFRGSNEIKLGFIVTKVNQRIENNDWITELETQTVILDPGKQYVDLIPTEAEILKGFKFAKVERKVGSLIEQVDG